MKALGLLAAAAAAAAFLASASAPASTTCLVSNRTAWGTNYSQPGGAGANCAYGTALTYTNTSFFCNKPLASYGKLPLKVTVIANGPWAKQNAGAIILSDGCTGDSNSDTIDLILDDEMKGAVLDKWGNGQDAVKYNGTTGPNNVQWTGEFQCGHVSPGAHQDALQMQAGQGNALVNGKTGNWNNGTSTCLGAGGATFYSSANKHFPGPPTSIYGGQFVTCNHGLYGGKDINHGGGYPVQNTGTVNGASFRTGRKDGTDTNCGSGGGGGMPCAAGNTLTTTSLTCQVWDRATRQWKTS